MIYILLQIFIFIFVIISFIVFIKTNEELAVKKDQPSEVEKKDTSNG